MQTVRLGINAAMSSAGKHATGDTGAGNHANTVTGAGKMSDVKRGKICNCCQTQKNRQAVLGAGKRLNAGLVLLFF